MPHGSPNPAPYYCSACYTETESREEREEKEGKTGKPAGRREEEEPQVNSQVKEAVEAVMRFKKNTSKVECREEEKRGRHSSRSLEDVHSAPVTPRGL